MKRSQGFTLVELIIVIVILGILAVTAAPRFLNMSGEAQRGVLNGVSAALNSGASMVYGKSLIAGQQNAAIGGTIATDGIPVSLGYPKATAAALTQVIEVPDGWVFSTDAASGLVDEAAPATAGQIRLAATAAALVNDGCYVQYTIPTVAETRPTIVVEFDGC